MKKSLLNIKHFVDSNVRNRIDKSSSNDSFSENLINVEKTFDELRQVCIDAEKKISSQLQSNLSSTSSTLSSYYNATINNNNNTSNHNVAGQQQQYTADNHSANGDNDSCNGQALGDGRRNKTLLSQGIEATKRHKKLPILSFNRFLTKSSSRMKPDSLLATTFSHCSRLQSQLAQLYLNYEQNIEKNCLQPLNQMLDHDIPNVLKCRKSFIKANNDLESIKARYNGFNNKQQQQHSGTFHSSSSYNVNSNVIQQSVLTKLDQLKKELDDATNRFNQARDTYAMELFGFISREQELVNLFVQFYQIQAHYHQQAGLAISSSMPTIDNLLKNTPRKPVFGTSLSEHLRVTGRELSIVVELCVMLLMKNALNEEGLFRISASSMKVKKLKNAIDAWHVSMASDADLRLHNNQHNDRRHANANQPQEQTTTMVDLLIKDIVSQDDQILTDSHTIAAVLKLHLRELPEPLLTYQLNEQWLEAAKVNDTKLRLQALWHCCQQLPKVNFVNLRHLIRLLSQITSHSETNKMSSTNLAIAVAPSLLWTRNFTPMTATNGSNHITNNGHNSTNNNKQHTANTMDNAIMTTGDYINQPTVETMSNVNLSTSLHVSIIDNLIYYADWFFPDTDSGNNTPIAQQTKQQQQQQQQQRDNKATTTGHNIKPANHDQQQQVSVSSSSNSCSSPSPSPSSMSMVSSSSSASSGSSIGANMTAAQANSSGQQKQQRSVQKPSRSQKPLAPQTPRQQLPMQTAAAAPAGGQCPGRSPAVRPATVICSADGSNHDHLSGATNRSSTTLTTITDDNGTALDSRIEATTTLSMGKSNGKQSAGGAHSNAVTRPTVPPPNRPKRPDEALLNSVRAREQPHRHQSSEINDNSTTNDEGSLNKLINNRKTRRPMSAIICSSINTDNGTSNHFQLPDIGSHEQQLTVGEGDTGNKQSNDIGKRGDVLNTISLTSLDTTDDDEDRIIATTSDDDDDSSFDDHDDDHDDHHRHQGQQGDSNILAEASNNKNAKTISWSESVSDLSLNAMTISPSKSDPLAASSVSPVSTDDSQDDGLQPSRSLSSTLTNETAAILQHDPDATITADTDQSAAGQQLRNDNINNLNDLDGSAGKAASVSLVSDDATSLSHCAMPAPPKSEPVCSRSLDDGNAVVSGNHNGDINKKCTIVYCGGPPPVKPPRANACQLVVNQQSTPL